MKFHIILTIDYELFGNGSGCLKHCVLNPTSQCLSTLDPFKAPLSFFVDATEFQAISEVHKEGHYPAYPKIEAQLSDACNTDHNLQLHLHPQWLSARYKDPDWELDFSKWRIGNLSQQDVDVSIENGLAYLRSLLGSNYDPQQHLIAYRAGGWAIQPSDKIIPALQSHGIQIDTTVAPGMLNPAKGDWFDFRNSPKLPFWQCDRDVLQTSESGICEVPIATEKVGYTKRFKALREHRQTPSLPNDCHGSYGGPNSQWESIKEKITKLGHMNTAMLDFCTTPGWLLIEITQRYMQRFQFHTGPIPIVAIGHNKNFTETSSKALHQWLDWAASQGDITFSDFRKWQSARADQGPTTRS